MRPNILSVILMVCCTWTYLTLLSSTKTFLATGNFDHLYLYNIIYRPFTNHPAKMTSPIIPTNDFQVCPPKNKQLKRKISSLIFYHWLQFYPVSNTQTQPCVIPRCPGELCCVKRCKIVKLAPPKCEQVQLYKGCEAQLKSSVHAQQTSG